MSEIDVAAHRAADEKATPGPWASVRARRPNGPEQSWDCGVRDADGRLIAECFEKVGYADAGFDQRPSVENAALILLLRNSHAAMLSELERGRACRDALREIVVAREASTAALLAQDPYAMDLATQAFEDALRLARAALSAYGAREREGSEKP